MSQFQQSPHKHFVRSPHFQRNRKTRPSTPCQRILCRAAVPFTGFAPFPAWMHGEYLIDSNSTEAQIFEFQTLADTFFALYGPQSPGNNVGPSGIAKCPFGPLFLTDADNPKTRYRKIATTYTSHLSNKSVAPELPDAVGPGTYDGGISISSQAVLHPLSGRTELVNPAGVQGAQSASATMEQASANAVVNAGNGPIGSWAISDAGVITTSDDFDPQFFWVEPTTTGREILNFDWYAWVATFAGSTMTLGIGPTGVSLIIFLPAAALIEQKNNGGPGTYHSWWSALDEEITDLSVICRIDLSDPHDMEEALGNAEKLLDLYDLDNLNKTYPLEEFDDVLKFGHKYMLAYLGPHDGVAFRAVMTETETEANFPYTCREWWGNGTFSLVPPVPYDRSDIPAEAAGLGGTLNVAKSLGGRLTQPATLYSEHWVLPRESNSFEDPALQGLYGEDTDCITWTLDKLDLPDLIYDFGRATMQRTCALDTLCTP